MSNTLKFGNGEWYGKEGAILAYNDENNNYKPLLFNFDRVSSATRVNKDGLIETVGVDQPRVDYKDDSKGALLLEPSRTNLVTYSEDFSNSYWVKANSFQTGGFVSPSGYSNANKISENTLDTIHQVYSELISTTVGQDYCYSIFAKKGERNWIKLQNGSISQATFNLENGTIGTVNGSTATIKDFGNGWYRCEIKFNAPYSTDRLYVRLSQSNSIFTYLGDGKSGVYLWGAMVETGSYATSYIPTQGSVVTRDKDVCNGAGNDSIFSEAEGVLYVESEALANDETSRVIASISNSSENTNRVVLQYTNNVGGNQVVAFAQTPSGYSSVHTISITNALTFNKFAIVYNDNTNNFDLWVNGTKLGNGSLSSSFTANSLTTIQLADGNALSNFFYGKIKDVRVYNKALTDAELAALTS